MASIRLQRVSELILREIAEILRRESDVALVGLLSVNNVQVSKDLKHATVMVGVVGRVDQRSEAERFLTINRKRFQTLLAHAVVLRSTPQLRFVIDDSIEKGNRVLSLIEEIEHEQDNS